MQCVDLSCQDVDEGQSRAMYAHTKESQTALEKTGQHSLECSELVFFVAGGGFFDSAVGSQFASRSETRSETPKKAAPKKAAPTASASGTFLAALTNHSKGCTACTAAEMHFVNFRHYILQRLL